jgi:hypothetical protein
MRTGSTSPICRYPRSLTGIVVRRPWENGNSIDADAFKGLDV